MATVRTRRVTSADVAREAGVSRTTVSYVLNDTPHQKIPEETRRRVLDAVARLEYAPSAAARTLQRGRSDTVLCLLPNWPIGPAVGASLEHLSAALTEQGLTLLAHPSAGSTRALAGAWRSVSPAAVVLFEDADEDDLAAMRAEGIQVTVALLAGGGGGAGTRRGALEIPQQRAGRLQAEHLAAAGHRRLGYAFPADPRVAGFAEPRLAGVRAACADLGLDDPVVLTVPLDIEAAKGAVATWREAGVTAVCAYNDDVALALLTGVRRSGLAVPGDLAVIGFDDIPGAAVADPPLTTVTTDHRAIAEHIAQMIVHGLEGREAPLRPGSDVVGLVRRDSA
ncbi:LacI family DNA-binding transcriptional regulator [Cellulomonas cellasea]|uniref:DNA-binding LacI/PurR family transcriptional regulator n=1 Tax=Cellulomonas cellasea TaxID=43670 RepID=A0A7W4YB27_9CELL|nr:LacI family DNA-binding transcriptional regulator [Cellulomonas cellasea]MBB2922046.1 DNA-binding LacI/PurR family transcriptional regulator [Cellulomonas cellasea]